MVFCCTKEQARNLAQSFEVQPYHAANLEEEEYKNIETLGKWRAGSNIVMVSTSILGCGLDYSHVHDVVHRGPSYTMMDHYQEDSRGGRDGLECVATTFFVPNQKYSMPTSRYDLGTKALYDSLYKDVKCLRLATTLYLDGQAVQCISIPGASFCANCESQCGIIAPPLLLPRVSSPPLPSRVSYR